jgi:hypothetical protein
MPWWQPLKGVLSRTTPEWYVQNLAMVGVSQVDNTPETAVCLWNNSSTGAYFYVYALLLAMTNSNDTYIGQFVGTPPGTLQGAASPVIGNQANPPGQIYVGVVAQPSVIRVVPFLIDMQSFTTYYWSSPFPLIVIPPNMGFALAGTGGTDVWNMTFWYVWK